MILVRLTIWLEFHGMISYIFSVSTQNQVLNRYPLSVIHQNGLSGSCFHVALKICLLSQDTSCPELGQYTMFDMYSKCLLVKDLGFYVDKTSWILPWQCLVF